MPKIWIWFIAKSGKHHGVVSSINIITLLWTDGNAAIPIDFRIYDIDADGKTLKKNWLVNPDNTRNVQIQEIGIPPEGREVHLKAYGFIKVFEIVPKDGDIEYWATDLLEMDEVNRDKLGGHSRKIEEYRRGFNNSSVLKVVKLE